MNTHLFHYPITIRYSDLDPQWHVNNARFLSFSEQARYAYLVELGLFDGKSFWDLPLIVGDIHCRYLAPIEPGATVFVWIGVDAIGTKSLTMGSVIQSEDGKVTYAELETVMVAYDYHKKSTIPVSDKLRKRFEEYEGRTFPKVTR